MATPPRRFVDLHLHTLASDGALSPRELVAAAEAAKLAAIAVTDHDTLAGVAEALEASRDYPQLRVIPGVEVSAKSARGTLHIVGLAVDPASAALAKTLANLQEARRQRNPNILARLSELGVAVTMDDLLAVAGGQAEQRVLGRLHIAQAMMRKGYVSTVQEAFAKYLATGQPAYVDKERLTPRQAIEAIHAGGGLAVLAHPPQLRCENRAQLECLVRDFIHAGLDGIEAYHAENSPQEVRDYLDLARRFGLGVSGGSDFHGPGKPHSRVGRPRIPIAALGEKFERRLLG